MNLCESPVQGYGINGNVPTTPLDRLKLSKQQLEAQLHSINDAIAALEANPDLDKALTTLLRAQGLGGIY